MLHTDIAHIEALDSYLVACVRRVVKQAISHDTPLKIPHRMIERAGQEGTLEDLYAATHVSSLDTLMSSPNEDEIRDLTVSPIYPTDAAPPRDPHQYAYVERLLSCLSLQEQAVIRLHYGLLEDDESCCSPDDIARQLDITRDRVYHVKRRALAKLRACANGQAVPRRYPKWVPPTRQDRSTAPNESPKEARARACQQRLDEAYSRLQAQGVPITGRLLSKEAHGRNATVVRYLQAKRGMQHAAA